eukprot:TRINITY_DN48212_c0_g1_i1.p1 TRINITY_DN48212_c0_g1~~TRINITY_DN48212_c0_g1_i1.p1  ORF type:complete len:291 (+),score=39.95 TRINITY_DN48212_c0_g1_i1:101-973(+)
MAALQVTPELIVHLTIKHTFFHYDLFADKNERTASSCPPCARFMQKKHFFIEDEHVDLVKCSGPQKEDTYITQEEPDYVNLEEAKEAPSDKTGLVSDTLSPAKADSTSEFETGRLIERTKSYGRTNGEAVVPQDKKLSRPNAQKVHRGTDGKPRSSEDTFLILRGLPFQVGEGEIKDFLCDNGVQALLAPSNPVTLILTQNGKPSGLAELRLAPFADMSLVRNMLDYKYLGGRYVEVLVPNTSAWRAAAQSQLSDRRDEVKRGRGGGEYKRGYKGSARRTSGPSDRDCRT